jgi:hypothetical protein
MLTPPLQARLETPYREALRRLADELHAAGLIRHHRESNVIRWLIEEECKRRGWIAPNA